MDKATPANHWKKYHLSYGSHEQMMEETFVTSDMITIHGHQCKSPIEIKKLYDVDIKPYRVLIENNHYKIERWPQLVEPVLLQ